MVPSSIKGAPTPIIAGNAGLSLLLNGANALSVVGTTKTNITGTSGGSLNASTSAIQADTIADLTALSPAAFPTFTGTPSLPHIDQIPQGTYSSLMLGTGWNVYTFTGGNYYINSLIFSAPFGMTLNLAEGNYFIKNFDPLGTLAKLTLNTSGKVRLFIGAQFALRNNFNLNTRGATENLQIYLFPGATAYFGSDGTFNGLIYGPSTNICQNPGSNTPDCIYFSDRNTITGALLSGNRIHLNLRNSINFSQQTQNAIGSILIPGCTPTLDHYELSLPSTGLTCDKSTVAVTACSDKETPCTTPFAGASGKTMTLETTAGTLGATSLTFDKTGKASTTLSYNATLDGAKAKVTLSGVTGTIQCCKDGTTCTSASSCEETFTTAGCPPDHYELSLPSTGIACEKSTVKVTACADSSAPCTTAFTSASGTTATLATTEGSTLGATSITFDATGKASTTLSYPAAKDGDTATVTLSGVTGTIKCCQNGNCTDSASCAETFNTENLIFSASATGDVTTLPDVNAACSAPTPAKTYYLRTIKPDAKAGTCLNAPVGSTVTKTVKLGYQCNNPTTCSTGSEMMLSGTKFSGNTNGQTTTLKDLTLNFDANGSAPFSFDYFNDAGKVTLYAALPADSTLLTALSAEASFVVAPAKFALSDIPAAPLTAGDAFNVTVTAQNACDAATQNFGQETPTAATATITSSDPAPALGNATAISKELNGFKSGAAKTDLTWNEVGTVKLTATTSAYLGSALNVTGSQDSVGRFKPAYFDVDPIAPGCGTIFTYSGQPIQAVTVTARAKGGKATKNYGGATWAKELTLSTVSPAPPASPPVGSLSSHIIAATSFSEGIATPSPIYTFTDKLSAPASIPLRATDTDSVTSNGHTEASATIRSGRLALFNATGSEKSPLQLPVQAQYWSGKAWVINSDDSCTTLLTDAFARSGDLKDKTSVDSAVTLSAGQSSVTLTAPAGATSGSVDIAANLGNTTEDQSCLTAHGGAGAKIPWLRSRNGNCAATYDRDPLARATFGIYSPETRRAIYVQENF